MTKDITQHLSIKDKVKLFKELYTELSGYGCDGDTELAHINSYEAQLLKSVGGSGTVNQITGLHEYKGGGSPPPPPPAASSVSQTSEFPEELKPYIKDVLGKAQAIQEKRETEGYIPYEGPQIAEFSPEQQEAFTGISGLVGQGEQYFDPATRLAASSAIAPRAGEVQQYMSPYMQNVVDIQQREARRQADVAAQQLGAQAVGAGGYGGSRQAILEAEQQRNLQTQLGDIQGRGLAAAYEDAQRRIAEQRGRELSASGQFMQLGQVAPAQQQRELTALEAVGAQRQAQSQRGLDIARSEFEREQLFPEQTLQQYQSVIRGFPLAPTTYQTSQTTTPAPSYLQQAAGLGMGVAGIAGAFGGFGGGRAKGGLVGRMQGGQVDQTNGLGSIVVKKQEGGRFVPPTRSRYTDPNYQNPIGKSIEELVDALGKGLIDPPTFEYRIEQLRKGYNKAGMPLEQEPIPKELGRSPLSVSPAEARIAAQERKMNLSSEKSMVDPASPMSMLMSAMENRKFANAPTTMGIPIEEMNKKDIDPTRPITPMSDDPSIGRKIDPYGTGVLGEFGNSRKEAVSEEDKLTELRKQIQAGMSMADQPTAAPTAAPKSQKSVEEDIIVDQDKGAGLGTARTISGFDQQAENILKNKPAAEKTLTSFGKEISDLRKTLDERAEKKKTTAQRRKDGIERDKFLAVAQMGLNILAQDGGQTFLQAIGKGSKNVIPTLMKLSREELEVAENLDDLDFETAKTKLGLTEAEFNRYVKQRTLDIAERKAMGGTTTGKGMQFSEMKDMFASLTGKPKQTLGREGASLYVYKRVNEEALKRLTPKQREDDSTVIAMERSILFNPELVAEFTSEFEQKYPNARTITLMGQTGAPAVNRESASSILGSQRKNL